MDLKKKRIVGDYKLSASAYEKRYASIQFEKFKILGKLNGLVLDLGGGSGLLGKYLRRKDLVNLDISFEMLRLSDEINICGDLDYLPFKSSCFDTVISFTALQNLPSFDKVFREINRVSKGKFVCSVLAKTDISLLEKEAKLAGFRIKEKGIIGEDVWFTFRVF